MSKAKSQEARPIGQATEGLEKLSQKVTLWTGSTWAFVIAAALVLVWAMAGPFVGFSAEWQLIINTGTTIATFLMVFLIQRAQNKEAKAVQLKLNELIAAMEGASNRLVGIEELSEAELGRLHDRYLDLADSLHRKGDLTKACSVEETDARSHAAAARRRMAQTG
jgi:low affinity Fe/Cu permease